MGWGRAFWGGGGVVECCYKAWMERVGVVANNGSLGMELELLIHQYNGDGLRAI